MQVQFDLQQMSTNAWFIIFTRPIHLSLSLSISLLVEIIMQNFT